MREHGKGTGQPVGIYIHLPFCERKCEYCDFPSHAGQEARREEYTRAVIREITERGQETGRLQVDTVFLGGGTPSLMEPEQVAAILAALRQQYQVLEGAEITCEANPGSLGPSFLKMLREEGVNRLSLGAQSADPEELRLLGRIHTWEQVEESVALAREHGFDNLNIDLMTALPGQTWEGLARTLFKALALAPSHLSCYSLIIEEGTPFYDWLASGKITLPEEDREREMYWNTVALLQDHGFIQYEISNFSLPGCACRHNENTWQYRDYLGFGASAAGLHRGRRRKNPDSMFDYLAGLPPLVEDLSPQDQQFEQLMLGLRLKEGLSLLAFQSRQGRSPRELWPQALDLHVRGGLLEEREGHLRLTDRGFDLMDRVLLDFYPDKS